MREVAIVSYAQLPCVARDTERDDVEMVRAVVSAARDGVGVQQSDIGFTCSGSSDYLQGLPFSFVSALDGVGAWPPISESHVEMDGAFALYEAWVRLQHGDIDLALVYAFGKPSQGNMDQVLALQLDPYFETPLWPDPMSLAALQARVMLEQGVCTERDIAAVVARNLANAKNNPNALRRGDLDVTELMGRPHRMSPLRAHDAAATGDSACAVVLATAERARSLCANPAWIRGFDHRIESQSLGLRDLSQSTSAKLAAQKSGALGRDFDVAELHTPFAHHEILLRNALGLTDATKVNPSGGALAADPIMVTGLIRIAEAASHILDGSAQRTLAHATGGQCLQQNLICWMEARS